MVAFHIILSVSMSVIVATMFSLRSKESIPPAENGDCTSSSKFLIAFHDAPSDGALVASNDALISSIFARLSLTKVASLSISSFVNLRSSFIPNNSRPSKTFDDMVAVLLCIPVESISVFKLLTVCIVLICFSFGDDCKRNLLYSANVFSMTSCA